MNTLLKLILLAIIAVLIAVALDNAKAGHVIILINSYRLDLSLIGGIILILITFIVLYYLVSIISGIERLPEVLKLWSKNYVAGRKRKYLELAIISFLAHDYKKSYKVAKRVINNENTTAAEFIALCIALESAHAVKNNDKSSLIKSLNQYNGRRYKLVKQVVLGSKSLQPIQK